MNHSLLPNIRTRATQRGFTLVELLVVVMLIVVLSGVVLRVINVQGIRQKSRDSQRISDLKRIQTALELYFADNRTYPATGSNTWIDIGVSPNELDRELEPNYLSTLPTESQYTNTVTSPCPSAATYRYNYRSVDRDSNSIVDGYMLTAIMEVDSSNDVSGATPVVDGYGCNSTNLPNWTIECVGSMETAAVCYGVQNP